MNAGVRPVEESGTFTHTGIVVIVGVLLKNQQSPRRVKRSESREMPRTAGLREQGGPIVGNLKVSESPLSKLKIIVNKILISSLVYLAFLFPFKANAQVPIVKAVPANRITYYGATLNALVNPSNDSTTISFEYGLTTSYGATASVSGKFTGNTTLFVCRQTKVDFLLRSVSN